MLPPLPIRSVLQSGYFSGFRTEHLTELPKPLAGFEGPTSKGRGQKEWGSGGTRREGGICVIGFRGMDAPEREKGIDGY